MEIMLEVTDKYLPLNGNLNPFPDLANVGPPYMATLSLPGFMISLPIWLFSTSVIPNTPIVPAPSSFSPQLSLLTPNHQDWVNKCN